ncbi:hypothetical protein QBC40DRAFT_64262 [Triangularia verruculosa]|uniref:ubiquitinyl hydrolase 1 n=1 Tax=Triangularia verruculosa TaxID=2587418 RepID=A0AAN6XI68_9PEZI|nr:hypothetical protein QBC40DRAFT_64262 [Triangularia verruculosa]
MEVALFNHLALPVRVPPSEDSNLDEIEVELIDHLLSNVRLMCDATRQKVQANSHPSNILRAWNSIRLCLESSKAINRNGRVNRTTLLSELRQLGRRNAVIIHISSQNAALLVHRLGVADEVVFEVFETSPRNDDVLAAENALQWDFPGSAVAIPLKTFEDGSFQASLTTFLEQASLESTKMFAAHTFKAGADIHEYRDTPSPTMISSMLMAILEENGRRISTPILRKRVRDDISWHQARKPWRRLPYWLVLRVSIARYLSLALGAEMGRFQYKMLICVALATFLESAQTSLEAAQVHFLKAKLCRRLAKLDVDRDNVQSKNILPDVDALFDNLTPRINGIISNATRRVADEWDAFKRSHARSIPELPKRASPTDLHLPLQLSGDMLRELQTSWGKSSRAQRRRWVAPDEFDLTSTTNKNLTEFAQPLFDVTQQEIGLRNGSSDQPLKNYLDSALPLYRGNPEQLSILILNTMEWWMRLDQATCLQFPLLTEYHPVFTPDSLNVLHLATYTDMVRLQDIQQYISKRIHASNHPRCTVFDDPSVGCFATRYYDGLGPDSVAMRSLHAMIDNSDAIRKEAKREEWETKTEEFQNLTRQVDGSSCILTVDENNPLARGFHDVGHCPRCRAIKKLERIRIQIYEESLPSDPHLAKAAVFELRCPPAFAKYRDATWMIISQLGTPEANIGVAPKCLLNGYSQLRNFASMFPKFTLASVTKSFLQTHYANVRFPVEWEGGRDGLCKPNGLRLAYAYIDQDTTVWTGRVFRTPSFAHHVQLNLPEKSPLRPILCHKSFAVEGQGPTSYEIMATQPNCPSGLNPHEFLALKSLLSGSARRWFSILTELASTNLNWSSEGTMTLLLHLALQCGPSSDKHDPLRLVHSVFRDTHFVEKLLEQVNTRLATLAALASWRETHLMRSMIVLALRIQELARNAGLTQLHCQALESVTQARNTCISWLRMLRKEVQTCTDMSTAQQLQQRALGAALLCRRTFMINLGQTAPLDPVSLEAYIESTVAIQENMTTELDSLSQTTLHDLVFATKLSYQLQNVVAQSISQHPEGLYNALKQFWPDAERLDPATSTVVVEQPGWIRCELTETDLDHHQAVHLNFLLGTLLVNGKPVGRLPQNTQNEVVVKELFGDQPLMVYQSSLPSMTYTLKYQPKCVTVHIGYERGETVVIARYNHLLVRLIPRESFCRKNVFDLPSPLIWENFHWLNLKTGRLYITPRNNRWNFGNVLNWEIDIHSGYAQRQQRGGGVVNLVNPMTPLFQRIANIVHGLAQGQHLLVTQKAQAQSSLEVRVNKLELLFFVNHNSLLYSPQLGLEIDPLQDAGTWYGLEHKLVCRRVHNPFRRTILVPLPASGAQGFRFRRSDCHVDVVVGLSDKYGKFDINDTLGRIDCAAEPALVYAKALIHALTSFPLPDPLTGRTGTEESLHWLQSGICRPWTVLGNEVPLLLQVASLTPTREYYPSGLKGMKTDFWDEHLTTHIQHPLYRPVVQQILSISNDLRMFHPPRENEDISLDLLPAGGEPWLNKRALARRRLYERREGNSDAAMTSGSVDRVYLSRDKSNNYDKLYKRVMETSHFLRTRPAKFQTPSNLAAIFALGNVVGGYGEKYDKVSLNDRMYTDIQENWGALVEFCRARSQSCYSLVFLFANLAFREATDDSLLRGLVAFAVLRELRELPLPRPWPLYFNFRPGAVPQLEDIIKLLQPFKIPPPPDETENLGAFLTAKQRRKIQAAKDAHEIRSENDCHQLAKVILAQWPCEKPDLSKIASGQLLLDVAAAFKVISPEWQRLYRNMELCSHLKEVQVILDEHHQEGQYSPASIVAAEEIMLRRVRGGEVPALNENLLGKTFDSHLSFQAIKATGSLAEWCPLASLPQDGRQASKQVNNRAIASNAQPQMSAWEIKRYIDELQEIVDTLGTSKSLVRQKYAQDLRCSLQALKSFKTPAQLAKPFLAIRPNNAAKAEVIRLFEALKGSLVAETLCFSSRRIDWLRIAGLWPAMTTTALLEQLRSTSNTAFGPGMREGLIKLGLALTKLQREMRLNDCVMAGDTSRYQDEEANTGHQNWDPAQHPDWLLLEIEANLLIRPGQIDVARATISPESGSNSVLQMNMGEGKTSCIIPMCAAFMADSKSLVRVIVPKALLLQTALLLQSRLGVMLNRHIRHIPFSRRTSTQEGNVKLYFDIHKQSMINAGVMLCLPEHNLSFMLSGQQRLLDGKINEAKPMMKVHNWIKSHARDILDESDYTLATRTQLIYPSGNQMSVDGRPHRWLTIQALLSLVDQHLYGLQSSFPNSLEVVRRPGGGFPLIYFLRQDVEDELLHRLTSDITNGLGNILPMHLLNVGQRRAVVDFLSPAKTKLGQTTLDTLRKMCPERPEVRQTVYLLRGLLVNRILIMTLKKRWNVQYGLHPNRDPVAVPFHAKGVPSDQSEWGHPDVAILFTCLVFYYDGILESQLRQALARVLKSDDPSTEYDKWVQSCNDFPESLKAWNGINVEDNVQIHEIWKAVRYRTVVIDYYLNNFVFPRHAKQFKVKLQSSGWDIPLFSAVTEEAKLSKVGVKALTTGFSGTNDNRTMLPLTIQQADLPTLSHTNAEVLTYLLYERSRRCQVITDRYGMRATERDLLYLLKERNIQVLIDAGAQILEMDNMTLAKTWLSIDGRCNAALYFDSSNKPWVIDRQDRRTPLLASPYADDLSRCLVYLDEAHTRGTDLKLPLDACGALTVGQGQSKDHTVQAAMRLRQLGKSQRIMFFVPPEVNQVIKDLRKKTVFDKIDSHDVICWLLDNTCDGIEQLQPLYFSQGMDFCRRTQAAIDNPDCLTHPGQQASYVAAIKQNELQTLQEMYEPKIKVKAAKLSAEASSSHPKVSGFLRELNNRRKGFQDTGRAVHGSALQEVEQEREVAFEVETVRQVKKPVIYDALTFPGLGREIEIFARTGRIPPGSLSVCHVFELLSRTAVGRKHKIRAEDQTSQLFVSVEFGRTVRLFTDLAKDTFLRPVNWILWSGSMQTAIVLIPEEAEIMIQMIRDSITHPRVHLICYASPVTRSMLPFNKLNFFSMPPLPEGWAAPQWLRTELGILAGRLYFEWEEYEALCKSLGVDANDGTTKNLGLFDGEDQGYGGDGAGDGRHELVLKKAQNNSFAPRPLTFLQEWLAIRRHGQDFVHTPMGFLTQSKPLQKNHPFFGGVLSPQDGSTLPLGLPTSSGINGGETGRDDEEDYFDDGLDDMGANGGVEGDGFKGGKEVVYDESELLSGMSGSGSYDLSDSSSSSDNDGYYRT